MFRSILTGLLVVAIIGGLVYFFWPEDSLMAEKGAPSLAAVPPSAALVLQINDAEATLHQLHTRNKIWQAWMETTTISDLEFRLRMFEMLMADEQVLAQCLREGEPLISVHQSGAQGADLLLVCGVPNAHSAKMLSILEKNLGKPSKTKEYKGAEVRIYSFGEGINPFHLTLYRGLLITGTSLGVIEESVRQLNTGAPLDRDPAWQQLSTTSGSTGPLNFYFHPDRLGGILTTFMPETAVRDLDWMEHFAGWGELDLQLGESQVTGRGFFKATDSLDPYLGLFRDQEPPSITLNEVVPNNTAFMAHLGIGDFRKFHRNWRAYAEVHTPNDGYSNWVAQFDESDQSLEESVFSWMGNEVALVVTEAREDDLDRCTYAVIATNDADLAGTTLLSLAEQHATDSQSVYLETYAGTNIGRIEDPELLSHLFGPIFSSITGNYFARVGNALVFANYANSLREFINRYDSDRTLSKDIHYFRLADNFTEQSHIFLYINLGRTPSLLSQFLSPILAAELENNQEVLRQFEALAWQITHDQGDLYFSHLFANHNPVYREETPTLWATALDSSVSQKPFLITNSFNRERDIVVQDDGHKLYRINKNGQVLWSKELGEPVMGKIRQVDLVGKGKFQLLFATTNRLHLMDRNGDYLSGFPVNLKTPATADLMLVDYDNKGKWRIMIPTGNRVRNYDKKGKPAKGWKFPILKVNITQPLQYFKAKGKDYVVVVDESGKVHVTDRTGKGRVTIRKKLPEGGYPWYLLPNNDYRKAALISTDSMGRAVRLTLRGKRDTLTTLDWSVNHQLLVADLEKDESLELIYADTNHLSVFEADGSLRFEQSFEASTGPMPSVYAFDNEVFLGVPVPGERRLYLFHNDGRIRDGFPFEGTTTFSIGDLDREGPLELVTGNSDKKIHTFTIHQIPQRP